MLKAVLRGHEEMQVAIQAIAEFAQEAAGDYRWDWQAPLANASLETWVTDKPEEAYSR